MVIAGTLAWWGTLSVGFPTINSIMESLWENGSYMRELMLCVRLVPHARREHISQTTIEPVSYYLLDEPKTMG